MFNHLTAQALDLLEDLVDLHRSLALPMIFLSNIIVLSYPTIIFKKAMSYIVVCIAILYYTPSKEAAQHCMVLEYTAAKRHAATCRGGKEKWKKH